jgi:hypothetical protein
MGFRTKGMENPYYPVSYATPFLHMFGEVVFGHLLLDMAMMAQEKLDALYADKGATTDDAKRKLDADHPEATFYSGKVHTARFFIKQILPNVFARAQAIESADMTVMNVEL